MLRKAFSVTSLSQKKRKNIERDPIHLGYS